MTSNGVYERIQQIYVDEAGQNRAAGVLDVGPCEEDGKIWVWHGEQLKAGPFYTLAQAMQWTRFTVPNGTPFQRTRGFDLMPPEPEVIMQNPPTGSFKNKA